MPSRDHLSITASPWSLRQIARRALVRCAPRRRLIESLPGTRAVYLTFDDGPHPDFTLRLLEVLAKRRARATFFLVGRQCELYPELVRRIAAEGHAIGNHTYSHVNAREVSPAVFMDEVAKTNQLFASILGKTTSLFRPPHGALSLRTMWQLWNSGQTIVLWNVDPKDYHADATNVGRWFAAHEVNPGDIVLLHDNHAHTPAIVDSILCNLEQRGTRGECLSQFAASC